MSEPLDLDAIKARADLTPIEERLVAEVERLRALLLHLRASLVPTAEGYETR